MISSLRLPSCSMFTSIIYNWYQFFTNIFLIFLFLVKFTSLDLCGKVFWEQKCGDFFRKPSNSSPKLNHGIWEFFHLLIVQEWNSIFKKYKDIFWTAVSSREQFFRCLWNLVSTCHTLQTRRAALPPARLCLLLRESNETSVGIATWYKSQLNV